MKNTHAYARRSTVAVTNEIAFKRDCCCIIPQLSERKELDLWLLSESRGICVGFHGPARLGEAESTVRHQGRGIFCAHTRDKRISREHSSQNQIWCGNMKDYMVFGSVVGSDYHRPEYKGGLRINI